MKKLAFFDYVSQEAWTLKKIEVEWGRQIETSTDIQHGYTMGFNWATCRGEHVELRAQLGITLLYLPWVKVVY